MTTLATMRSHISLLTQGHITSTDIDALINRVHQEEVESQEWHYRQKRFNLASVPLKSDGTITVASGSTKVMGTGTSFATTDKGKHIRIGSTLDGMPIEIANTLLFPNALNFTEYNVTSSAVVTIQSSFSGVKATKAEFTVLGGNIRYTIDGTTPTPSVGMQITLGNSFEITGHTNLDNFQMIAEAADAEVSVTSSSTAQELTLAQAWPGAAQTNASYEMFQKYYALPADVDKVQAVMQAEGMLKEWSLWELDLYDPDRNESSDQATHWARAGENSDGQKLIELWPIETSAQHYTVEYLAGHTPLVNESDRPMVPPTVIENRALIDACAVMFSLKGDQRWLQLMSKFEMRYNHALERLAAADSRRFGRIAQVLDLDAWGYGRGNQYDYSYLVDHDVGY